MLLHRQMMLLHRYVAHLELKSPNTKPLAADGTDASCVRPWYSIQGRPRCLMTQYR